MMQVKIDKGIPAPEPQFRAGRPEKYPWGKMVVGDSFFVPGPSAARSIRGAKRAAQKRTGHKYAIRTVTENGVRGARVWRIE